MIAELQKWFREEEDISTLHLPNHSERSLAKQKKDPDSCLNVHERLVEMHLVQTYKADINDWLLDCMQKRRVSFMRNFFKRHEYSQPQSDSGSAYEEEDKNDDDFRFYLKTNLN